MQQHDAQLYKLRIMTQIVTVRKRTGEFWEAGYQHSGKWSFFPPVTIKHILKDAVYIPIVC